MTDLAWRRILMTGAAGRIGATLRAGLAGRHPRWRLLDRRPVPDPRPDEEVAVADLGDQAALHRAVEGVDALIHLAGAPDPLDHDEMFRANVDGITRLFAAARRAGVRRIVFASSNHAYGMRPVGHRVRVDEPPRPDSFYGVTKAYGETLLRWMHDKHGVESVSLRIGSFGDRPGQQRHLSTWLSPRDAVELFDRALKQPGVGAAIVVGMSRNARLAVGDPNWAAIGYAPVDDAESHAARLRAAGVAVDGPPEWRLHGGMYEPPEY
jgi:uronate dehydrogenase